mgnify:CR=1 FL=1
MVNVKKYSLVALAVISLRLIPLQAQISPPDTVTAFWHPRWEVGVRGGYLLGRATAMADDSVRFEQGTPWVGALSLQFRWNLGKHLRLHSGLELESWEKHLRIWFSHGDFPYTLDRQERLGGLVWPWELRWQFLPKAYSPWSWELWLGAGYRFTLTFRDQASFMGAVSDRGQGLPPLFLLRGHWYPRWHHGYVGAGLGLSYYLPGGQRLRLAGQYQHGLSPLYTGQITFFPDVSPRYVSFSSQGHMLHLSLTYEFDPEMRRMAELRALQSDQR